MSLKQNGRLLNQLPLRYRGGSILSFEYAETNKSSLRNIFVSNAAINPINGVVSGHLPPSTWLIAQKSGGLSAYKDAFGVGTIVGTLAAGRGIDAIITNTGTLTAVGELIVSGSATITNTGTMTGNVVASLAGASTITGTSTVSGLMNAIGYIDSNILNTSNFTGVSYATGFIEAEITPFTELSPQALASSVWNSVSFNYLTPGTMGEKLNASASAGDPWGTAIPAGYVEGTAGYKLGTLNTAVSGSASISAPATGFVLTTGIETNSYLDTTTNNTVRHIIDDIGNIIDGYYTFNVGPSGVPVGISAVANLQSSNDSLNVSGWDFSTSTWVQVGILPGTGSSGSSTYSFPMFASLVGSGANQGEVRIRFNGGSSNPRLDMYFLYLNYAVVSKDTTFQGVAQAATSTTLTFPLSASSLDNYYFPGLLLITSGEGVGQSRRIESYNGSTRTATIATPWVTTPDTSSGFSVLPWGSVRVSDIDGPVLEIIASYVWDYLKANPTTPDSMKEVLEKAKKAAEAAFAVSV